ncbi:MULTISPECIES: scabin-related ADP-ribosyltransferase [Streptosporangium]|uniref:Uncharacterized protein n=1 Tax=Streptosporangium brasiliense TaxID=47480 RepID=A0ABT9R8G9_9ACTN|nr:hypothetical protein [Streptosporangium brasiliense]MDP9865448.1 hypothetical protein [Streptosporangium brasiliense]
MALQPPAELAAFANIVGVPWPVCDEDKMHESGQQWISCGTTLARASAAADAHAVRTVSRNEGGDVRAFERDWEKNSGRNGDAVSAAMLIGSALQITAMAVLALKVALIVIIVRFAVNMSRLVTAAGPTSGASLTAIPAVVGGARLAVRQAVRRIVDLLKRSALRLFGQASKLLRKSSARQQAAPGPQPPKRPPTPLRGPDNYLESAVDKNVDVKSIVPYPIWRRDRPPVYRADNRPPEEVFEQGFHPRDTSMTNLDDYVNRNRPSAFVGTSTRQDIDNVLPRRYVYEVDAPGGIDVRDTFSTYGTNGARLYHEQEIAFPGGVHRRYISGAWPEGVPKTPENFISNPHYDPYPGYPRA